MSDFPFPDAPFFFITGGCRSGKSAYAQAVAEHLAAKGLYIATAYAHDEDMRLRVRRHQQARGPHWRLHEVAPGKAAGLWQQLPLLTAAEEVVLLDCLTLWTSACMQADREPPDFAGTCALLIQALRNLALPVVVVSNEVGMGVVPESSSGRIFRDMAGVANQQAAAAADHAIVLISGMPFALKGSLPDISGRGFI